MAKTAKTEMVTKWFCGVPRYSDDAQVVVASVKLKETAMRFTCEDKQKTDAFTRIIGWETNIDKCDKRFHDTREAAIKAYIAESKKSREELTRKASVVTDRIGQANELLSKQESP